MEQRNLIDVLLDDKSTLYAQLLNLEAPKVADSEGKPNVIADLGYAIFEEHGFKDIELDKLYTLAGTSEDLVFAAVPDTEHSSPIRSETAMVHAARFEAEDENRPDGTSESDSGSASAGTTGNSSNSTGSEGAGASSGGAGSDDTSTLSVPFDLRAFCGQYKVQGDEKNMFVLDAAGVNVTYGTYKAAVTATLNTATNLNSVTWTFGPDTYTVSFSTDFSGKDWVAKFSGSFISSSGPATAFNGSQVASPEESSLSGLDYFDIANGVFADLLGVIGVIGFAFAIFWRRDDKHSPGEDPSVTLKRVAKKLKSDTMLQNFSQLNQRLKKDLNGMYTLLVTDQTKKLIEHLDYDELRENIEKELAKTVDKHLGDKDIAELKRMDKTTIHNDVVARAREKMQNDVHSRMLAKIETGLRRFKDAGWFVGFDIRDSAKKDLKTFIDGTVSAMLREPPLDALGGPPKPSYIDGLINVQVHDRMADKYLAEANKLQAKIAKADKSLAARQKTIQRWDAKLKAREKERNKDGTSKDRKKVLDDEIEKLKDDLNDEADAQKKEQELRDSRDAEVKAHEKDAKQEVQEGREAERHVKERVGHVFKAH